LTLRFGTDGVRGSADTELTPVLVHALGRAAARVLDGDRFVIGRDTRESGPRIEADLTAGLAAEGCQVDLLGVVPTPAVAWFSAHDQVPAAVISASHNSYADNGIKLFSAGGVKLTDAIEERLEGELESLLADGAMDDGDGETGGRDIADQLDRYTASIVECLEGRRFDGLKVVIDCANGAASELAPALLSSLGAQVDVIHAAPDGRNINEGCGSTHPGDLQQIVVQAGADVGLAFDGDADRVLAVDEMGDLVDGDQILAMCAIDLRDHDRLRNNTVVVTVMSNLGFRHGMAATGIDVVETQVGDRYVLEELEKRDLSLGGEQSGHIIFRDLATTGDGLLTGLVVLDLLGRTGRTLSDWVETSMVRLPQVLRSVRVVERDPEIATHLHTEIAAEEALMGGRGRVLIRPSGTEPVVRVMVEAPNRRAADEVADRLVKAVERLTTPDS
jgi:phosphoglucosamine mutase